jgi:hypothetical protein
VRTTSSTSSAPSAANGSGMNGIISTSAAPIAPGVSVLSKPGLCR